MKKLIVLLGVAGVSVSALLVRYSTAPSLTLVVYRMAFAALLLLPWAGAFHRNELRRLRFRQLLLCGVSGLFLGLHFFAYFASLQYTSIASSVVLVDTEVFWVAGLMFLLTGERVGKWGALGIALAFAGSIAVVLSEGVGGSVKGGLIALAGAAFMAVYTVIGRLLRREVSTTLYTALVYGAGFLTAAALALATGVPLTGWGREDLWIGLGLAVFCTLLGHSVFSWGLKYEKAAYISTVKFLEPVFASVWGILFLQEIPPLSTVLGALVILGGVALCAWDGGTGRRSPEKSIRGCRCQTGKKSV
ncbi:DMT family transporter [Oscillibacter hominis]|uniref:DMT family transporter n=1 Tax=Oscillibacter hominis TaxID=2763056 RepID=A0A7G9B6E7_9FIRM|nr:DMT family transporter [Oscillibacter hominis]QNL45128.1 DMT family transporter [Oscillibacter hominis]